MKTFKIKCHSTGMQEIPVMCLYRQVTFSKMVSKATSIEMQREREALRVTIADRGRPKVSSDLLVCHERRDRNKSEDHSKQCHVNPGIKKQASTAFFFFLFSRGDIHVLFLYEHF